MRSPAGPRRLGTATRISASLSRRLFAFFGSTLDRDPKSPKYAVLTPGHAGFPNRVKRSEGSDSALPPCTFRKYCAQSDKTATSPSCKQITQPSGAATPRNSDAHERIAVPKAFCVLRERPGQGPKAAKFAVLIPGPGMFVNVQYVSRVVIAAPSGRPLFRHVSRCVRSCWRRRVCTRFHL